MSKDTKHQIIAGQTLKINKWKAQINSGTASLKALYNIRIETGNDQAEITRVNLIFTNNPGDLQNWTQSGSSVTAFFPGELFTDSLNALEKGVATEIRVETTPVKQLHLVYKGK